MLRFKVEKDIEKVFGPDKLIIQTVELCPMCGRPMVKADEKVVELSAEDDLKKFAAKVTEISKGK